MTLNLEIIKPYSRRNFKKTVSRNCLKHKCVVKDYNKHLSSGKSSRSDLKANKSYYGLLYARKTLRKLRKSFCRTASTCNQICIARGKTNIAKSVTDQKKGNDKCAIEDCQIQSTSGKSYGSHLKTNKSYYGLLYARKTLGKLRKSIHKTASVCNQICIAREKTLVAKTIKGQRKSFSVIHNRKSNICTKCEHINSYPQKQRKKAGIEHFNMSAVSEKLHSSPNRKRRTAESDNRLGVSGIAKKISLQHQEKKPTERVKKHRISVKSRKLNLKLQKEKIKAKDDTILCYCNKPEKVTVKLEKKGKLAGGDAKLDISLENEKTKPVSRKEKKKIESIGKGNLKSGNMNVKIKKVDRKPCFCGSTICESVNSQLKSKSKKDKQSKKRIAKIKQPICTCGSDICKRKAGLETHRLTNNICECLRGHICECLPDHICECKVPKVQKSGTKQKGDKKPKKTQKKKKNEPQKKKAPSECCELLKQYRKERRQKKIDGKLLKRYKESSDSMLLAESVFDLAKMSGHVLWNVLKGFYKFASEPKKSYEDIKKSLSDPDDVKNKCLNSEFTATARRLKKKIGAMGVTKNATECLESNAVSRFMIHSLDKDPTKRLTKMKKIRKRKERIDFECSPYMASLRRRPFLWVYDRCPRLYPQFISMLTLWRQFLDIVLFLVAVAVWSPCIIGIEVCRALMCCCLCTG